MPAVTHKVRLLAYTPDPEAVVAAAAAVCYASEVEKALHPDAEHIAEFLHMLRRMGHLSPFEHASFTFLLEGVSRALTHQLVRHRIASYSQRSQRYVAHDAFDYVVPPRLADVEVSWQGRTMSAVDFFQETMDLLASRYSVLNDALGRAGESSNEDARYLLPNACETKIVVTMNARELLHFFGERLCMRAQWEIRGVARTMLGLVKQVAPRLFAGAGPKCVALGRCPEGRKGCGRLTEILREYAEQGPE